jgi:hypothetical protein
MKNCDRMRLAAIGWLIAGFALALTAELAWEHLWIMAQAPIIIWAALGVVLLVVALFRIRHRDQRRSVAISLVAIAVAALGFAPTARFGASLTTEARFALQRSRYERVISSVRDSSPGEGSHEVNGLRYVVDAGPPVRLAFPWPGGVTDNWCGAIFDPTKVVLQANRFNGDWSQWHNQVSVEVIRLFGGDMLYCRELDAPFYHCCFT